MTRTVNSYILLAPDALVNALAQTPGNPWPNCDDRQAWERIARTPHGTVTRKAILAAAEEFAAGPPLHLPTLTDFIAFTRSGDRKAWETPAHALAARLDAYVLAACFTGEARWADEAANALWAICEMTTWVMSAHEYTPLPDPDNPYIDLGAAMRAQQVAEIVQVLGPALDHIDRRIVQRVQRELKTRIFDPFLARGDFWWLWPQPDRSRLNNWTAVCSGGVLIAALAALNDTPDYQARVVGKAAWSLQFFKDTFESAGSLDEGAGYWSYGMSYYVMAAERLTVRTSGQSDPLANPLWREVAQFPTRVRLYGDTFVNFSDCAAKITPPPGWVGWLGTHLDVPPLVEWAVHLEADEVSGVRAPVLGLPYALRNVFWKRELMQYPPKAKDQSLSAYLLDVQWLIARSDESDNALVLAVKGGHNAENHNHNDGGSFLVHANKEALICELGAPTYTRQFFGPERYQNIAARSLGHSVPFVNGHEQQAGREFAARVVSQVGGEITLDLAGLYGPEAEIASLTRQLALVGGDEPRILLSDSVTFTGETGTLALPLITLDNDISVVAPGEASIIGKRGKLRITWEAAQSVCHTEEVPTSDPRFMGADGKTRIRCLWFAAVPQGNTARLNLTLVPMAP